MNLDDLIALLTRYRDDHPHRGSLPVSLQLEYAATNALAHPLPRPTPVLTELKIYPYAQVSRDHLALKFYVKP